VLGVVRSFSSSSTTIKGSKIENDNEHDEEMKTVGRSLTLPGPPGTISLTPY
jgi:hypothetical protein